MSSVKSDDDRNKIGLIGAISYIVGTIIGSGIFVSPIAILKQTNSIGLSLIVWLVSGLLTILIGLVYVELGTSIRESGNEFAYITYVGWHPLAFAFLWLTAVVSSSSACAILAMTFGEYVVDTISPFACEITADNKKIVEKLIGFMLLLLLTWINFFSVRKYASRLQIVITIVKLLSVALIIVTGFYYIIFQNYRSNFIDGNLFRGSTLTAEKFVLALYAGNWAYGGYDTLNYGAEEVRNYRRTLPIAVIGGLMIAIVFYLLANIAYFALLTPAEMLESSAVASTFSKKALGNFYYAMPAIVGILMTGTLNANIFTNSRFILAGARKSLMPTAFALCNLENNSPRVAIILHTILSILLSFVGGVDKLINYRIVCNLMQQSTAVAALIYIHYRRIPVHPQAIRFPIFLPILLLLFLILLIVIPIIQNTITTIVAFGFTLGGIAVYYMFIFPTKRFRILQILNEKTTILCQILFSSVIDNSMTTKSIQNVNQKSSVQLWHSASSIKKRVNKQMTNKKQADLIVVKF